MNFQSARQISDGAAVAASRKSNAADGNSDKIFSECNTFSTLSLHRSYHNTFFKIFLQKGIDY